MRQTCSTHELTWINDKYIHSLLDIAIADIREKNYVFNLIVSVDYAIFPSTSYITHSVHINLLIK